MAKTSSKDKCDNCGTTESNLYWDFKDKSHLCDDCYKKMGNSWGKYHQIIIGIASSISGLLAFNLYFILGGGFGSFGVAFFSFFICSGILIKILNSIWINEKRHLILKMIMSILLLVSIYILNAISMFLLIVIMVTWIILSSIFTTLTSNDFGFKLGNMLKEIATKSKNNWKGILLLTAIFSLAFWVLYVFFREIDEGYYVVIGSIFLGLGYIVLMGLIMGLYGFHKPINKKKNKT